MRKVRHREAKLLIQTYIPHTQQSTCPIPDSDLYPILPFFSRRADLFSLLHDMSHALTSVGNASAAPVPGSLLLLQSSAQSPSLAGVLPGLFCALMLDYAHFQQVGYHLRIRN